MGYHSGRLPVAVWLPRLRRHNGYGSDVSKAGPRSLVVSPGTDIIGGILGLAVDLSLGLGWDSEEFVMFPVWV